MAKRGRPTTRLGKRFISEEHMAMYFSKQLSFEDATRVETADDCTERVIMAPTNFSKAVKKHAYYGCDIIKGLNVKKAPKFFSLIDLETGEIYYVRHYVTFDQVCIWFQNQDKIRMCAHY